MDPEGMVDGPNMYQYCGGDPVNHWDPMGTEWQLTLSRDGTYTLEWVWTEKHNTRNADNTANIEVFRDLSPSGLKSLYDAAAAQLASDPTLEAWTVATEPEMKVVAERVRMGKTRELDPYDYKSEIAANKRTADRLIAEQNARVAKLAGEDAKWANVGGLRVRPFSEISEKELSEVADIVESFEIIGDFVAMYRKPGDLSSYIGLLPLASAARIAKTAKKGAQLARNVDRIESANLWRKHRHAMIDYMDDIGSAQGGRFDEVRFEKMKNLMESRIGIKVFSDSSKLPVGKAAGFDYETGSLYFRSNTPTELEVIHELYHAMQWRDLGKDAYKAIRVDARERHVYEKVFSHPLWSKLSAGEQLRAIRQYEEYGGDYRKFQGIPREKWGR